MEQRLSIVTLGADDLPAMRNFYIEKFGWKTVAENKDIVFFQLNGLLLGLYGRKELAAFANMPPEGSGFRRLVLAHMVDSKEKVEALYAELKSKGVKILKEPQAPPIGGYYFLVTDIEGNVWEFAWNIFMPLDEQGNVITHQSIAHL